MYCKCTIFPKHRLFSAFYPIGMSHVHGPASDPCLPDTASTLIHCYIFKNISFHCLPSSHFLLSSSGFLLPFWRILVVAHGAYRGTGGKVILLDFKFFRQSRLSQWPKHLILGHWWIDFTIFEADLARVFSVFTTSNSDRPILRHFCLLVLATESASLICTARLLGLECKFQLIKALEVECY